MHQTRAETSRKIPIQRKGTKYVARALGYRENSVPVIIAVRDMLKLAKDTREVKSLVHAKMIKINGRLVRDVKEPILLLNILEAGKKYKLMLTKTGKYILEETKGDTRICKVTGKKVNNGKNLQLNLHDGTNIISKEKINVGDSVELDSSNKVKKIIQLEKGKEIIVMSGKSIGYKGKILQVEGRNAKINLEGEREVVLEKEHIIAI